MEGITKLCFCLCDSLLLIKTSVCIAGLPRIPKAQPVTINSKYFFSQLSVFSLMTMLEALEILKYYNWWVYFVCIEELTGTEPREEECYQDDSTCK